MKRTIVAALVALGAFGSGAALLEGCTGQVGSGGTSSQLQPVSASVVSGPVVTCNAGSAHPNVCCEAAPGQASSCGVYPNAPFQQCEPGSTTYPDPRSCCPLDGQGACAAPPPVQPPPAPTCVYACPVGAYEPDGQPGTCCQTGPDGSTSCWGSAQSQSGCVEPVCECPACLDGQDCPPCDCGADAGTPPTCTPPTPTPPTCNEGTGCACAACPDGQDCPPCDCPPPEPCPVDPAPPACDACPAGWQSPEGAPYLCCSEEPDGAIACFSQGVPPSPPSPEPLPAQGGTGASN